MYPRALESLLHHGLDHGQWDKALDGSLARESAKVVFDRIVSMQATFGPRCTLMDTPVSVFGQIKYYSKEQNNFLQNDEIYNLKTT